MTSEVKPKGDDRIGLWMLVAVIVITGALFLWTRAHFQHNEPPIGSHLDAQGNMQVLGVTLGQTTLKEAESILESKSDVALYIYPQGHEKEGRKMEAFFPAIADHTKVILRLDLNSVQLDEIEERATIPHLYPNQVARMNLAAKDRMALDQAIISELTLIPNLTLTTENIQARFGQPDQIDTTTDQKVYHYRSLGLDVTIIADEPPTLHFFQAQK